MVRQLVKPEIYPRAVVMVGLPYPNLHSPELKEKMSFLNRTVAFDKEGKQAGQVANNLLLVI